MWLSMNTVIFSNGKEPETLKSTLFSEDSGEILIGKDLDSPIDIFLNFENWWSKSDCGKYH